MSLFPQFPSGEFTSLFRLLDDYDVHRSTGSRATGRDGQTSTIRAFRPKFDVRELKGSYELQGELPGIDQKDINIEFVDPHTLVITGRIERSASQGNAASITGDEPARSITAATDKSNSSRKATVEGGDRAGKPSGPDGRSGKATDLESAGEPEYTCWVSERSVGEFHRSFTFPSRVDQDAVTANLKNGILTVTVPKLTAPVSKKIRID
jgi:HSP20 family molecular chaperone IbpA